MSRRVGRWLVGPLASLGTVAGAWYAISYLTMEAPRRRVVLPPPHEVVAEGLLTWREDNGLPPILRALAVTARVSLAGLVVAAIVGLAVGWTMHRFRLAERVVFPWAVVVQTTPVLALVPLIKIWFGSGVSSRVLVCVLISVFPVITNAHFGFRSVPSDMHDLFTLSRATRRQRFLRLELPCALPSILTGLRIAAGACVIGAVVGDYFFKQGAMGIGRLIDNLQKDARTAELLAATLMCSMFGVAVFTAFGALSRRIAGWSTSQSGAGRDIPQVTG